MRGLPTRLDQGAAQPADDRGVVGEIRDRGRIRLLPAGVEANLIRPRLTPSTAISEELSHRRLGWQVVV